MIATEFQSDVTFVTASAQDALSRAGQSVREFEILHKREWYRERDEHARKINALCEGSNIDIWERLEHGFVDDLFWCTFYYLKTGEELWVRTDRLRSETIMFVDDEFDDHKPTRD